MFQKYPAVLLSFRVTKICEEKQENKETKKGGSKIGFESKMIDSMIIIHELCFLHIYWNVTHVSLFNLSLSCHYERFFQTFNYFPWSWPWDANTCLEKDIK